MSRIVPVLSAEEAVKLVPAGATVSVSSSSGLGCPTPFSRPSAPGTRPMAGAET